MPSIRASLIRIASTAESLNLDNIVDCLRPILHVAPFKLCTSKLFRAAASGSGTVSSQHSRDLRNIVGWTPTVEPETGTTEQVLPTPFTDAYLQVLNRDVEQDMQTLWSAIFGSNDCPV